MEYSILEWDTKFLNKSTAKITSPVTSIDQLSKLLRIMTANGVKVVYWSSTQEYASNKINELSGQLVDTKTTFGRSLDGTTLADIIIPDDLTPVSYSTYTDTIEELAVMCGVHSRFAVDPKIARSKFEELYKIWVRKSLERENCEEFFVIRNQDTEAGFVTLSKNNNFGNIGLLAVHERFRGKKIGQALMKAAQIWFREQGCSHISVVTQGTNIPACNLYKKCGYQAEKIEYFYHFHL